VNSTITGPFATGSAVTYKLAGLTASSGYCADVQAVTSVGAATAHVCFTTKPPSRPSVVVQLQSSVTSGAATITWQVPVDNGGAPILSYQVQTASYASFTQDGTAALIEQPAVTDTTSTIYGLHAGTKYIVMVAAVSAVAASGDVEQISVTTLDVSVSHAPEEVFVTVSDAGSVTVQWQPPRDNGGAPIISFVLRSSDSVRGNLTYALKATVTSFEDTPRFGAYRVSYAALAVTRVGNGTVSRAVEAVFSRAVGVPTVRLSLYTYNSASVSWTAPLAPEGKILVGYFVSASSGAAVIGQAVLAASRNSFELSGLKPSSNVLVSVYCDYSGGVRYMTPGTVNFTTTSDALHSVYAAQAGSVITGPYADSSTAYYMFKPTGISGITFSLSSFDVECDNDYVSIYDAARPSKPVFRGGCKRAPFSVTVMSTTYVIVQLTSDATVHGNGLVFNYTARPSALSTLSDAPAGASGAPVVLGHVCSGAGIPVASGQCSCNENFVGEACATPLVVCPGSPLCSVNSSTTLAVSAAGDDTGNGVLSFGTNVGAKPLATLQKAFSAAASGATVAVVSWLGNRWACML
jgi:hypothetical protein